LSQPPAPSHSVQQIHTPVSRAFGASIQVQLSGAATFLVVGRLGSPASLVQAAGGQVLVLLGERRLSGQLAEKGQKPLLGAPQVSNMITDLYQELSRSLPGLSVRESDLTLRFAMQPAGEQAGFQLFGAEPGQESGPVSELHLKLDRRGRPAAEG
jgi:hypothetical protein